MTGEVVTGTSERLVTGDAVNVAARLEQAAAPGDVLIGEPTLALVRDAVAVESIEPLQLKGKSEPLPAFRLLRVLEAPERRHDRPFVGRDREVGLLQEAWRRATADRRCELVTIVGEAGVGKSRLVAEALTAVDARIVRCHCLPYGEGITYRPVVEVLKQLDLLPPDATAAAAIRTLLGESDAHDLRRRDRLGIPQDPRARGYRAATRGRLRRHPVGRGDLRRPRRARRAAFHWRPHPARLHGPARVRRAPADLARHDPPRTAHRQRRRGADPGRAPFADSARGSVTPPAATPCSSPRCSRSPRRRRATSSSRPRYGRCSRHASTSSDPRSADPRARRRGRRDLPPRRRPGALRRRLADHPRSSPALVRKRPDRYPTRPADPGRRRLPFPPPPAARHGLRRPSPKTGPCRPPPTLRRPGSTLHGTDLVELDEILGHHLEQAHLYRSDLGLPADDELAETARQTTDVKRCPSASPSGLPSGGAATRARGRARPLVGGRHGTRDRARGRPGVDGQDRRSAPARRRSRRARRRRG